MLFQPTNIIPNVLGGAENSAVNVSNGMTISWQINGNSSLVAYRIGIYENDIESTQLYSTGIVTLSEPIPAIDHKGEPQRCNATIAAEDLSEAGITNGKEYKIAIRQYWDADNLDGSHSIRTSSEAVFLARRTAHVDITSPAPQSTIASYQQTFVAQYYQGSSYSATAEYDPIEWVRWRIYDSADRGRTIYDSQKIYTQELKLEYDGLLNDRSYVVVVDIQNSVGQSATDTALYDVSWQAEITKKVATATQLNNQSSAVKVSWDAVEYIRGVFDGSNPAEIYRGRIHFDGATTLSWSTLNGAAMNLPAPWGLIMYTELAPRSSTTQINILNVAMTNGYSHVIAYDATNKQLKITPPNGSTVSQYMHVGDSALLKICIDDTRIAVYKYIESEGLTPSTSLRPSATLTPEYVGTPSMVLVREVSISSSTSAAISRITVGSTQWIDLIEVVSNITSEQKETMRSWASSVDDSALSQIRSFEGITFLADFDNKSADAGNFSIGGRAILGWDVYRKRKSEAFARHLCSLTLGQTSFLDYGCGSQQGKYTYFIYPKSYDGVYITSGIQTNTLKPVFWNWSIVEAEYVEESNYFNVLNEYIFRNNVASGSVSNNNTPTISDNFTRFPTVQMSNVNYQSGSLSGLIGQVGYTSYVVQYGNSLVDLEERFKTSQKDILEKNGLGSWENHGYAGMVIKLFNPDGLVAYRDDKEQRDALWALSTTTHRLFLKSRKGDVIEIRIAGAITMETMDNTPQQAITASIPWVQVDDAADKTLICAV